MYRIRFHGRGGQGMKTASRMLGTALFKTGFDVQDAPRYGAERRGAPMVAFVRAARQPIRERGVIDAPDLVLVADASLVTVPAAGVLVGIRPQTVMVIVSPEDGETWSDRLKVDNIILTLMPPDAGDDAGDDDHIPDTSALCAGAAAGLLPVERDVLADAVREEIGPLGKAITRANLETAAAAYDQVAMAISPVVEGGAHDVLTTPAPAWVDLKTERNAWVIPAISAAKNSPGVETGLWRTLRPVVDTAKCKKCFWVCGNYCPDGVISVDGDKYPVIDYDHCKGCLICIEQCPAEAIHAVPETSAREPEEAVA